MGRAVPAGYMHRGYEKLAEVRTPAGHDPGQPHRLARQLRQRGALHPRRREADGDRGAAAGTAHPHDPVRASLGIANITLFLGDLGVQLGAVTPVFLAFRDREHVLNLIESVTGGRFHPNFDRIGGLKDDLPKGFIDDCRFVMKKIRGFCDENEDLLIGNEIFQERTWSASSRDIALQYGLSGPNLRQRRRLGPPPRPTTADGVGQGRLERVDPPRRRQLRPLLVRLQETRESTKIVDQLLDTLPSGPIMAKVLRIIKVPEGEAWVSTENPLGEMGYYVVSKGDLGPFRVKIRSASFNNVSIASWVLRGVYVPDIITILASLYFILGDIDR